MRYLFYLILIMSALVVVSCGSSGSGVDSSSSNKTTVVINLGQRDRDLSAPFSKQNTPLSISCIVIRVSAPDMAAIEKEICGVESGAVEAVLLIPNGQNRHFEIFAYDEFGALQCYGHTFSDVNGGTMLLTIVMVCQDNEPPVFDGIQAAQPLSANSVQLDWNSASDNETPPEAIIYTIYQDNFSLLADVAIGQTSVVINGFEPETTYYFGVRAGDEAGNEESNTVQIEVTTLALPDTAPPGFSGLNSATAASTTSIVLHWDAATDNVSQSSSIVYYIYQAVTSGGEDFLNPTYVTAPGATSYIVNGLNPGTKYYYVVRARDEAGNIDDNTVEKSAWTFYEYSLKVKVIRQYGGDGKVKINPPGISCRDNCIEMYSAGTEVKLEPEPDTDSYFGGWGGDCYVYKPETASQASIGNAQYAVTITMNHDKECTAYFEGQF